MCDIYTAKCALCDQKIPMHLGDFETKRDEIMVVCWRHSEEELREAGVFRPGAIVWLIPDQDLGPLKEVNPHVDPETWIFAESEKELAGRFVFIVPLSENALEHRLWNYPNLLHDMIPAVVMTEEERREELLKLREKHSIIEKVEWWRMLNWDNMPEAYEKLPEEIKEKIREAGLAPKQL